MFVPFLLQTQSFHIFYKEEHITAWHLSWDWTFVPILATLKSESTHLILHGTYSWWCTKHFEKKKILKIVGLNPFTAVWKFVPVGRPTGIKCPSRARQLSHGKRCRTVGKIGPSTFDGHIRPILAKDGPNMPVTDWQAYCARQWYRRAYPARHLHKRALSARHHATGLLCPSKMPTGIFSPSHTRTGLICPSQTDGPTMPVTNSDGHIPPVTYNDGPNLPVPLWRAYFARHRYWRAYSARRIHRRA